VTFELSKQVSFDIFCKRRSGTNEKMAISSFTRVLRHCGCEFWHEALPLYNNLYISNSTKGDERTICPMCAHVLLFPVVAVRFSHHNFPLLHEFRKTLDLRVERHDRMDATAFAFLYILLFDD
jgi:hypothetical protein